MSRLKARAAQRRRADKPREQDAFWPELCRRIAAGQLIPILGDAVFYEQLFDFDGDGLVGFSRDQQNGSRSQDGSRSQEGSRSGRDWSIEEQLADAWAEEVGYPLADRERLARVALYYRVVDCSDDRSAKTGYLNWLKDALLFLAADDPLVDPDALDEQTAEIEQSTFADIAAELGYPRPLPGQADTLDVLARLKLPIYVTTSYFDFLERAIQANGRTPRTQICFWSGEPLHYLDDEHRPDPTFAPTPETPLVYHLFGLEAYPESLVLTEDDYLDFLAIVSRDAHQQQQPILPWYLRKALTQSSLLLLGYRLRDWDFRVLFRGLINSTPSSLRLVNVAIQLDPADQYRAVNAGDVRRYLKGYFEDKEKQLNFTVQYDTTAGFVARLWDAWDQWRR